MEDNNWQNLALCWVKRRSNTISIIFVIIDSKITDYLYCNRDLFLTYTKFSNEFKIATGLTIIAHRYNNVILGMCDMSR